MANKANVVTASLGKLEAGGTAWIFRAPAAIKGGGLTVTDITLQAGGTATNGNGLDYQVIKGSSAGTPAINGTIVAAGTAATGMDSRIPAVLTVASGYVSLSEWVGVILGGTIPAVLRMHVTYQTGK